MRRSRAIAVGVVLLAGILLYLGTFRRDRGAPPPAPAPRAETAPTNPGTGTVTQGAAAPSGEMPGPAASAAKAPSPTAAKVPAPAAMAGGQAASAPASAPPGTPKASGPSRRSSGKASGAAAAVAAAKAEPAAPAAAAPPAKTAGAVASATPAPSPASAAAPAPIPAPALAAAADDDEGGPSGAIAGILIDAQGQPLALTQVLAVAANGADAAETFTLDDGSFLLPGLRPGRYSVFPGLGTQLPARLGARGVTVKPSTVSRVAFAEPRPGGTVRVSSLDGEGRPTAAQAILIADAPRDAGGYGSLLAADAVYLPELGANRTVLRNVPPGTYRVVLLRSVNEPALAAPEPLRVTGGSEVGVTVRVGGAAAIPHG
jgi:hypothetical protein